MKASYEGSCALPSFVGLVDSDSGLGLEKRP